MERRGVAIAAVAMVSLFVFVATASAHAVHHKLAPPEGPGPAAAPETCVVHALPSSFMDHGEFAWASTVADVIEVECEPVYAEHHVTISANELFDRCDRHLQFFNFYDGGVGVVGEQVPSTTVTLDNAGNASVVLLAGPSCAAGESLISAHLTEAPFTTVTTGFTVLPPRPTEPGVFATPATKVEDENTSSVATILQVEFPPVFAEEPVNINWSQLFARCHLGPKTVFLRQVIVYETIDDHVVEKPVLEEVVGEEITGLKLDNDGNAFVIVFGTSSCAAGPSLIEASLENAPYTTYTTTFTVEPPRPTFPE
jgi:hypothetical protein